MFLIENKIEISTERKARLCGSPFLKPTPLLLYCPTYKPTLSVKAELFTYFTTVALNRGDIKVSDKEEILIRGREMRWGLIPNHNLTHCTHTILSNLTIARLYGTNTTQTRLPHQLHLAKFCRRQFYTTFRLYPQNSLIVLTFL